MSFRFLKTTAFLLAFTIGACLLYFGLPPAEDLTPMRDPLSLQREIDRSPTLENSKEVQALIALDSISMERTPCEGSCPAYKLMFTRSGSAAYEGFYFVPRQGRFVGHISLRDFARLSQLIEHARFFELPAESWGGWTDSSSVVVVVVEGKERRTSVYGGVGPVELWAVQQALDAVAARVDWQPVTQSNASVEPH